MGEVDTGPVDLRISGARVLPLLAADPTRVIERGVVEVRGDRITHVGAAPSGSAATETLSAEGMLVTPAFVNTHCHTSQQLGRGLADDVDLPTWLHDRIWPYEAALSEADAEISTLACCLEQIRNGVTLLADPGGQHVDGMARSVAASGIRALVGRSSMDAGAGLPAQMVESTAEVLDHQDDLAARWHGAADGRIRMSYTLRTIFNCSDALILGSIEHAARIDAVVQMHVAEVVEENAHCRATRGDSTVRWLATLGVLGPRLLAVHVVHADDAELDLLAATATPVSHNAASNLRVLAAFPRIAEMLERGITVGIGTDGAPSNNRMSILDEMWLASLVQKARRGDPTALPAAAVVAMATRDGARALGWEGELGTLEVGSAADLVLIDPAAPNLVPLSDPAAALVSSLKSDNIHSVLCAGRWVLRDRAVTTVDEGAVLAEAEGRAAALRARIGLGRAVSSKG